MIRARHALGILAAAIMVAGCAAPSKPQYAQPDGSIPIVPEDSAFLTHDMHIDELPSELRNYSAERDSIASGTENLERKVVRDAGRRLGATAGYNHQAERLYQEIEGYSQYLESIFDFQALLLPDGVVPPVIAQTDQVISYDGGRSKTVRARVYKALKEARFANPRAPSWRNYLNLNQTGTEYPLPELQQAINKYKTTWEQAVHDGWERGHHQAQQGFEIAINELERDYLGMHLFHMLWLAEMVEPPRIVDATQNIDGGGRGRDEMSLGVRRIVISEEAYFIDDSSRWNALIAEASEKLSGIKSGLSDVTARKDNLSQVPSAFLDNNLRRP
ncbi:type IV secretory system conjugative DNA transfer family protein [Vreelandella rituensis]|uniref:Uncharacterized protein n=1 Tax=Vreelandella rituensis TaxID=2282306 RepID=A0A368UB73_9GAMM|nr:type IV secretory system conjugative DNA transfer family protein [Halomonas rituensis]RCV93837.1 hypothetical protein DU506_01380 [Halomonas rituensis]